MSLVTNYGTSTRLSGRRSTASIPAVGLIVLFPLFLIGIPTAQAEDELVFSAVASGQGVETSVLQRDYLLVDSVSSGGPTAQAVVDSVGTSRGFAALPDTGATTRAAPGLLAAGGASGVPEIPGWVESVHPTQPTAEGSTGTGRLEARSDEVSSTALATSGEANSGDSAAVRSFAEVSFANDEVVAMSETVVDAVSVGDDVLKIGRVRSTATAVAGVPGGTTVDSTLDVTAVSVAGTPVGFDESGIIVGDPLVPVGESPVDALEAAGISVMYLAPREDPDGLGIVSAGIEVTIERAVVNDQPATVVLTLGRTFARVDSRISAVVSTPDPGSPMVADVGPPPGSARSTNSAGSPTGAPAESPGATPQHSTAVPTPTGLQTRSPVSFSSSSFYLVLVAASCGMVCGGQLLSRLGVRVT